VVALAQDPDGYDGVACTGFGFAFSGTGGDVKCNGVALAAGVVPVTGTLDTGAGSASLTIADIGTAQLGAGTRVRLDRSHYAPDPKDSRHYLFLEHGRMHAKVNAYPKIFAVATPSANVVDLGCEYVLELDRKGAGSIRVITGKVELETGTGSAVLALAGSTRAFGRDVARASRCPIARAPRSPRRSRSTRQKVPTGSRRFSRSRSPPTR
jgi:hypothetical protein